jgi:hypothetical protein
MCEYIYIIATLAKNFCLNICCSACYLAKNVKNGVNYKMILFFHTYFSSLKCPQNSVLNLDFVIASVDFFKNKDIL